MHKLGDTATTEEKEEKCRRIKEKIRSIVAAERGAAREINSGSRLGNVLRQANRDDRSALGGARKGVQRNASPKRVSSRFEQNGFNRQQRNQTSRRGVEITWQKE